MKNVVIIGAGGHGEVVADISYKNGDKIDGILYDNPYVGTEYIGFSVLGTEKAYINYKILQNS